MSYIKIQPKSPKNHFLGTFLSFELLRKRVNKGTKTHIKFFEIYKNSSNGYG
jgi:hypothetical protein